MRRCEFLSSGNACTLKAMDGDRFCALHQEISPDAKFQLHALQEAGSPIVEQTLEHIRLEKLRCRNIRLEPISIKQGLISDCLFEDGFFSGDFLVLQMQNIGFKTSAFDNFHFSDSPLKNISFDSCSFIDTEFKGNSFEGFPYVKLTPLAKFRPVFSGCNFKRCMMLNNQMENLVFENCLFDQVHFVDSLCDGQLYRKCRFYDCSWSGVNGLQLSRFSSCELDVISRSSLNKSL